MRGGALPPNEAARLREVLVALMQAYPSQQQLADDLGISQPYLSTLLSGRQRGGIQILLASRRLTGRSIDDLLGLEPLTRTLPISPSPKAFSVHDYVEWFP